MKCNGKLRLVKTEEGYSAMQVIWSGSNNSSNTIWKHYECESCGNKIESSKFEKKCDRSK